MATGYPIRSKKAALSGCYGPQSCLAVALMCRPNQYSLSEHNNDSYDTSTPGLTKTVSRYRILKVPARKVLDDPPDDVLQASETGDHRLK